MHAELEKLSGSTTNAGYMPDTQFALHDVDKEEQVSHLCHDNEKLSIALGSSAHLLLLCSAFSRICCKYVLTTTSLPSSLQRQWGGQYGDSHITTKFTTKFIAKRIGRAIIIRNDDCFPHFEDGKCSCRHYQ
jgi:hypothetical protein